MKGLCLCERKAKCVCTVYYRRAMLLREYTGTTPPKLPCGSGSSSSGRAWLSAMVMEAPVMKPDTTAWERKLVT